MYRIGAGGLGSCSSRTRPFCSVSLVNDFHFSGPNRDLLISQWKAMNVAAEAGSVRQTREIFNKIHDMLPHNKKTNCYNMILKSAAKRALVTNKNRDNGVSDVVIHCEEEENQMEFPVRVQVEQSEEVKIGLEIYNKMIENQIRFNHQTFGKLIEISANSNDEHSTSRFYHLMKKHNFSANTVIFNILIDFCCKKNDFGKAKWWWDQMRPTGVSPTVEVYNTVIGHYARAGDVSSAVQLFDEMGQRNVKKNVLIFTTMIGMFFKVDDLDKSEKFLVEMMELKIAADFALENVLNSIVQNLAQRIVKRDRASKSHIVEAVFHLDRWINHVKSAKCKLHLTTYTDVILSYGMLPPAKGKNAVESVWQEINEIEKMEIDSQCWTAVLTAHCNCFNVSRAMKLFGQMENHDLYSFHAVLNGLVKHQDKTSFDVEEFVNKSVAEFNLKLNSISINILLDAVGRDTSRPLDDALNIFYANSELINVRSCAIVIDACSRRSDLNAASNLLDYMTKGQIAKNIVIWNNYLKCFKNTQDFGHVLQIYDRIDDRPTIATFGILLDIAATSNSPETNVAKIVAEMKKQNVALTANLVQMLKKRGVTVGQQQNVSTRPEEKLQKKPIQYHQRQSVRHKTQYANIPFRVEAAWVQMDTMAKNGMPENAIPILESIIPDIKYNEKLLAKGYNTVLKAYGNIGDLIGAERWLARIRDDGVMINKKTYGKIITAASRAGDQQKVKQYFAEMREKGFESCDSVTRLVRQAGG